MGGGCSLRGRGRGTRHLHRGGKEGGSRHGTKLAGGHDLDANAGRSQEPGVAERPSILDAKQGKERSQRRESCMEKVD